jgi:hypothetical protein
MQKRAQEVALAVTSHNQNTNKNKANTKRKQPQTAPKKLCTRNRKQQQTKNKSYPKLPIYLLKATHPTPWCSHPQQTYTHELIDNQSAKGRFK